MGITQVIIKFEWQSKKVPFSDAFTIKMIFSGRIGILFILGAIIYFKIQKCNKTRFLTDRGPKLSTPSLKKPSTRT